MAKFLLVIMLAVASQCHQQNQPSNQDSRRDIEDLINEVFPNVEGNSCMPGYGCVPYYLCSSLKNSKINDRVGIIDIRSGGDSGCANYLEQCCRFSDMKDEPIVTSPSMSGACGFRNVDGIGFKITGHTDNEAEFGEFPWMVGILKEDIVLDQVLNIYKCGGSLIHPSVVLTAAHCVANMAVAELKVRAGEWDSQTTNEIISHQDRSVDHVVYHPQRLSRLLHYDIALLFLESEFYLADNVKPICLPPTDFNFDHSTCFVTGWGKDVFGQQGKYQVILKKIDLTIVPRDTCQNQLRLTRLRNNFKLHDSFICAGAKHGKNACTGDGGSPLVCPIPGTVNRYYQAGSVAWGIGCGNENVPGVYASVAKARHWIDEQLELKNIDYSSFAIQLK